MEIVKRIQIMATVKPHGPANLGQAIDDYYEYNPSTLMPLLLLALAAQGKLEVGNESKPGATVFAKVNIPEVEQYEWVKLNPALKRRLKEQKALGATDIVVYGFIPDELKNIYDTFHYYDTVTVVQEFHHRMGRLVQHSSNSASDKAQRQYAILCLADELQVPPLDWFENNFLDVANDIITRSGIQPKRPRLHVAETLRTLLCYFGHGVVYNPFAGSAIAAAMVGGGENLYVDGDSNEKLLAIARLLCYGTGQEGCHVEKHDSTKWIQGVKADYVLSTFLGYVNGKSAFDFCLGRCLDEFEGSGKFAGIASPKDIFEKQSEEMKEALRRDWVDSIVLLPFGEVAVLIDAAKEAARKKQVRFYNLTNPLVRRRPVFFVIGNDRYASILKLSDVKKPGFLKSLVTPTIEQQDGCKLIKLGDLFEMMPKRTWSLEREREDSRVLAYIDRKDPFDAWSQDLWMQGIQKRSIVSLFAPAYKLEEDCLIVNAKGELEPRLFDADFGSAFFQDGYAFKKKPSTGRIDFEWLIHELCKPYVSRQLHPYGQDEMLPEAFSEEQVLSLTLNIPVGGEDEEEVESADKLESGEVLLGSDRNEYTIHGFLGNGNFGYAYSAKCHNLVTGEEKEVVIKEFYPHNAYHRVDGKVVPICDASEEEYAADREKFKKEAEIMSVLGNMPDSHIVPAIGFFECEQTNTMYYVMPFYKEGSFDDFLCAGERMTEDLAIPHVVIPLCKALNASQHHKILHLDIKPENILIDENGDAALTDYGTAKVYDEMNRITFRGGKTSCSQYAAPELVEGSVSKYDPRPDMFGIAGTIYTIVTRRYPNPIFELDQDKEDNMREFLQQEGCSRQFADALIRGLQASLSARPKNAQAFLNLFPGCENIKL